MKASMKKIVTEALQLPPSMRAMLAEQLIESLDVDDSSELSPAWREEILRRCAEYDEGRAELVDADEAIARAYAAIERIVPE
ncbi:hypothetical protein GMSM_12970 [Geomonas sp. Red276]